MISLGSWCRPAWQLRRHYSSETAYPFDWQITSYQALSTILSSGLDRDDILLKENCYVNRFGSVTDRKTGLIFQHDLPAHLVGGRVGSVFMDDGPDTDLVLKNVREKTTFLFDRFRATCQKSSIIFLRWIRNGHPDGEWPEVFSGESPQLLYKDLLHFCGHHNFKLLYVMSIVDDDPSAVGRCELRATTYGGNAFLYEASRLFRPEGWTGDDTAWTSLFDAVSLDNLGLQV